MHVNSILAGGTFGAFSPPYLGFAKAAPTASAPTDPTASWKNRNCKIAAITFVSRVLAGQNDEQLNRLEAVDHDAVVAEYRSRPRFWDALVPTANRGDGLVTISPAAAFLVLAEGVDRKRAADFWQQLSTGVDIQSQKAPVLKLRDQLVEARGRKERENRADQLRGMLYAFRRTIGLPDLSTPAATPILDILKR